MVEVIVHRRAAEFMSQRLATPGRVFRTHRWRSQPELVTARGLSGARSLQLAPLAERFASAGFNGRRRQDIYDGAPRFERASRAAIAWSGHHLAPATAEDDGYAHA